MLKKSPIFLCSLAETGYMTFILLIALPDVKALVVIELFVIISFLNELVKKTYLLKLLFIKSIPDLGRPLNTNPLNTVFSGSFKITDG